MASEIIASPRTTSPQHPVPPLVIRSASNPRDEITQFEMAALLSLRGRANQLEQEIANAENSIRTRLESGATVEVGEHAAKLKENFRRNVAWRDVVVRLADRLYGEDRREAYYANDLRNTKPNRSVSLVLL
jgi:hypothetical protein